MGLKKKYPIAEYPNLICCSATQKLTKLDTAIMRPHDNRLDLTICKIKSPTMLGAARPNSISCCDKLAFISGRCNFYVKKFNMVYFHFVNAINILPITNCNKVVITTNIYNISF